MAGDEGKGIKKMAGLLDVSSNYPQMKITNIFFFIIGLVTFNAGFAYAQEALAWQGCVRLAKEQHPDLISAAEKVKQTKADKDIELSSKLPQITTSASGKRVRTASSKVANTYKYSLTGEQLVFDGFKTSAEVSGSFENIKAEEYAYALTSSNIRLNLRSAFVALLKAQELLIITEEITKRRKQNLGLVKLRYEAGREHKGSLLTAEADLAEAEFEIAQAKRNISLAQRKLTKEIGYNMKKSLRVEGVFTVKEDYSNTPDFEYLADNTPFLRELIGKKEAARYNLLSEKADFLPQVYLNASVGRSGSDFLPRDEEWSAGMSISLPLFEGGSRIAEISKARSQLMQATADERSGRDSVLVTLESTWKNLLDGIENVAVKMKFLEAARERSKISSAQYEKGLTSFDDWVIIEDNLVDAKKAYLDAQADMLIEEAYWIQAIGGTLEYDQE